MLTMETDIHKSDRRENDLSFLGTTAHEKEIVRAMSQI